MGVGNLVIPNHDYLISVRNDYNLCKGQAAGDYYDALQACDSTSKAQGRVAMNLKLAQGKNVRIPMPQPLHLRGYQGQAAAAEVIRQAAQGGRRKRRKTRKHKKRYRRRKSTRKHKKKNKKRRKTHRKRRTRKRQRKKH